MIEPTDSSIDERWMRLAIDIAWRGQGGAEPNPMVGCVLVRDGELIGQGFHRAYGGPHAEANALSDCSDPNGATAYVTLEPCCHHGKTPPCSSALINAGVKRVVIAADDPFDQVDGGGIRELRNAGIEVLTGVLAGQANEQLAAYLKLVRTGMPWVIAKWAMSIDGKIATTTGESQWITSPQSRVEVHRTRGLVDGIAVGMGTVVADDPSLTAREGGPRTPARIVFSRTRVPSLKSQLVKTAAEFPTWLVAGSEISPAELAQLSDYEVDALSCTTNDPVEMIESGLRWLGAADNPSGVPLTNLLVEGGGELLGSFASAGQIDECHVYVGGKVLAGDSAPGPVGGSGFEALADSLNLRLIETLPIGDDVRLIYRANR